MRTSHFSFPVLLGMCLFLSAQSFAQILTSDYHLPRSTDSLLIYKMPYVSVNDSGHNCIWDFSTISTDSAEMIEINYFAPSEDMRHIGLHREHANYSYFNAHDTLWLTGYETSRAHMLFSAPVPILRYPFAYGDTLSGTFIGEGHYCHLIPINTEGYYKIHADAVGRLILPDMEIDSALRVHSIKDYHQCSHKWTHIHEEYRQWYSKDYRYPLVEIIDMRSATRTDTVCITSLYFYPQNRIVQPKQRQLEDTIMCADSLITEIKYFPNPVHSDLQISYKLTQSAQVYVSLHHNGGVSTYQTPVRQEAEGEHTISVYMGGMPIGNYVVYVHADDIIVSGNIIKF